MAISGKYARGKIGSNLIVGCQEWTFEEQAVELDAATAEDAGYEHPEAGLLGGTVRITAVYDEASGEYVPIRAGTAVSNLTLSESAVFAARVTIPSGVVMRSSKAARVRDRIIVTSEIKTIGSYTVTDT